MKILATNLWKNKNYHFDSIELAAEFTKIGVKRIMICINTGHKWKGWIFDEM